MSEAQNHIGHDWVSNTSLFHKASELRQKLERKKWIESEKAGHDIGVERARVRMLLDDNPTN